MADRQRQLLSGRRDQTLCQVVGTEARDHTDHQPREQRHGRELHQDVQARLRQAGAQARFTDGDGAVEGLVR